MADLEPGAILAHFRIERPLGQGGMGVVWLARDTRLDRPVALKVLPAELSADRARRERLVAEGRAAAALSHPSIATVYEVGEDQGRAFIAMELVEGRSLRAILDESAAQGSGGLPPAVVADYALQAAEALGVAHAAGFVHRDIKPDNLVVTAAGRLKVLDFGLVVRPHRPSQVPTRPPASLADTLGTPTLDDIAPPRGVTRGTAAYMSPEQALGDPLGPASDVFSLGIVMHEMMTGRSPFARASRTETMRAVLQAPAPAIGAARGRAASLEAVTRRALCKEPLDRYADGAAMAADLRPLAAPERPAGRAGGTARLVAAAAAVLLVAIVAAALFVRRGAPGGGEDLGPVTLAPLLVRAGVDESPAHSPDGATIVFSHDGDLFTMPADGIPPGAEPGPLTSGEGADTEPAWSPDGLTVAFTREWPDGGVEVWTVPAVGGEPRRIVVQASSPSWSPDGKRLAFVQRGLGRSTSILIVEANGRSSHQVTRPEDAYFHSEPEWSPDGRTIAFVKDPGGGSSSEIWLAGADGAAPRQLTFEPDGVYSTEPAWWPDGRFIVYASNRGGTRNIWRIPIDGGEPVRLTAGAGDDGVPRVSPDGRRIVFTTSSSRTGLFVRDRDGGAPRLILAESVGQPWGPAWSPDGLQLAYTRIANAGPWEIYIVPVAGGAPRRLDTGTQSNLWPRWSPDGRRIVFCTFSKGDDDIYVVPAEGGQAQRLTEGGGDDWWPAWSPDGSRILFSRTEGRTTRLCTVPAGGGPVEPVGDETLMLPSFAPDGARVAVARNRTFRHGVGLIPVSGGPVRWLTGSGGWPVFRPDGLAVGFIRLEPGGYQSLWEVPVDGGEERPMGGPRFVSWNFPFDYSPDGGSIAYSDLMDRRSDLWVLRIP